MYKSAYFLFSIIVFCSILSGVKSEAKTTKKKSAAVQSIFYPSMPDTPRMQFLTSFSGSNFVTKRSKFKNFVLGPEETRSIAKPYGIYMHDGKLYVCDPPSGGLEILDFKNKSFTNLIPGGAGSLKSPMSCAVDNDNQLYIADPVLHYVVIFDSAYGYVNRLGDTGLFKPTDMMIYKNQIFVTNPDHHTLNIYDQKTQALVGYFNAENRYMPGDEGFLYSPFNVYITDDAVYITDFGDFKIKIFDHQGKYLRSVGSYGTGIGQFVRPKGLAVDRDSVLYVVDAGFENAQMFNSKGQLLMFLGGPYKEHGDMWLPAKIVIDYDNLQYFEKYVDKRFELKYLVFVSNQYGPDKINVYGAITLKKGVELKMTTKAPAIETKK
jgi:DNA-binding beta-propeller fold protein YncE